MKKFAQLLVRRPVLFWSALVTIFVFGALLRIQTIDRGTPWLGIAVYLTLLLLFVATFALPAGIVGGALARWLLRWSITPWQTRIASAVIVAFIVFAAHTLGRTLPPWHVWATASTIAALVTLRTFRWGRMLAIAWHADRAMARVLKERQLRERGMPNHRANGVPSFASDDRYARRVWRKRMSEFSLRIIDKRHI